MCGVCWRGLRRDGQWANRESKRVSFIYAETREDTFSIPVRFVSSRLSIGDSERNAHLRPVRTPKP